MPDLINEFLDLTEGLPSPALFRLWSAIALVGGALERRVWVPAGVKQTFPNLYTLLVAPPGVGKQIIEEVRDIWREALEPGTKSPAFRVAPGSITQASLVDELAKARNTKLAASGPPLDYCSLLVASEELQVLIPQWDPAFLGKIVYIYQNPTVHDEARRTGFVKELKIQFPQLNLLGGTQPGMMAATFPEEAWSTGLTARILMIYSAEEFMGNIFEVNGYNLDSRAELVAKVSELAGLAGPLEMAPDGQELIWQFHHGKGQYPRPSHSKLEHYCRRRGQHTIKLALISAIARGRRPGQTVELADVQRAIGWLTEAEALMPDIFRAMTGRSDSQVLEELYFYTSNLWRTGNGKPIHEQKLMYFLGQRVPSEKIEKLLSSAERMGIIERMAGEAAYRPRAKDGVIE